MSGFRLIAPVLVRGPLLPVRALGRARAALLEHPLGPAALEVASHDLGAALAGGRAGKAQAAAIDRYGRRAAFRPTPVGLLGGVGLGALGARTRLKSGGVKAGLRPAWGRLAALGRGLLDAPDLRAGVKLRLCPSLLRGPDELVWLALGDEALAVRSAAPDELLTALVEGLGAGWVPWPTLRAELTAAGGPEEDDELDEWLLVLVDQGLVCHDLEPPLVGPPPLDWMKGRLERLRQGLEGDGAAYLASVEEALVAVLAAAGRLDAAGTRVALRALPGGDTGGQLQGSLRVDLPEAVVARRAVERAAALAPMLFRLQQALATPVAERQLDAGLLAQLREAAERFGAGAFSLEALAVGGYGTRLVEGDEGAAAAAAAPVPLLGHLVELLTSAARAGARQIVLEEEALSSLLPAAEVVSSFELFLTPAREPPRAAPGTGWLLGQHAPAGASFGRFAETLGPPLAAALADIAAAEAEARPGEQALDVVHAASRALGDLSTHPPVRSASLALTGWPARAESPGGVVTPADLAVVIDEAAAEPFALRVAGARDAPATVVAPVPLHRVRSTTVPAGLYRLLAGWSFARQHAPWAFTWPAPLAGLPFLPRVVLAGFVIAPASWRLPAASVLRRPQALARWRKSVAGLPRWVQVGQGDELLPVDLESPGAGEDLARHAGGRVFEIWPPLDHLVDRGGRRLEVVAAVVSEADDEDQGALAETIARSARAGQVEPPAVAPPADEWLSFRLFGAREHQDALLFEVVGHLVAEARAAGELGGWFFLRYLAPGSRAAHLRLRLLAARPGKRAALRRRCERAFAGARQAGLLVVVEEADYFRETARYGGEAAVRGAERVFELGSDLVLAILAGEHTGALAPEDDRPALLVRAADALARGLGLSLAARQDLAARRRAAFARALGEEPETLKAEFRARQRVLAARLGSDEAGGTLFASYAAAVASACAALGPSVVTALVAALPALLHMQAVRLGGTDPEDEQAAYVFWSRALEGLAARARR